jgi:hypothetical protein
VTPNRVLAGAYALFLVYAFPGYMSPDSIMQLEQARSLQYSDWHPPAMAALWTLAETIVAGPTGMLLLQGALFLAGSYRLLRRYMPERIAALAAGAILVFPPVLAPMAVIWKDPLMASLFVIGASCLVEGRRWPAAVLLGLGCAMRANAPAAALPLVVLLWPSAQIGWRRVAIAFAAWCAITAGALGVDRVLTRVPQHAWTCSLAPGDLGGIIRFSHHRYTDAELEAILAGTPLMVHDDIEAQTRKIYTPVTWWPMANGDGRLFNWPETEAQRDAIGRAWWVLVRDNPGAYLWHRWKVFQEVLGVTKNPVFDPVWTLHEGSAKLHHDASSGRLQRVLAATAHWLAEHTPLFRPYLYVLLALALLVVCWRQRDLVALLASGLVYELTMLPFAPSPDYRYSHWLVVCAVIALAAAISSRRCGRARSDA